MKLVKLAALLLAGICFLPVLASCSYTTCSDVKLEGGEEYYAQAVYYVEAARYDAAGNASVVYVYIAENDAEELSAKDVSKRYFDPENSSNYFVNTSYEIRKIIEKLDTFPIEVKETPFGYEYTYYSLSDYMYYDLEQLKSSAVANTVKEPKF